MIDDLDEQLSRMARRHIDAGGTMEMPKMDLTGAGASLTEDDINSVGETPPASAHPSSIPAQVGSAVMGAKPRADLSRPLGVDTELRGLQADAKQKRGEAALGQSASDFTERPDNFLDYAQRLGGGGVTASPAKTKMWDEHAEEGDRAIADLGQRRTADAAMTSSAEDNDPNSQTAQTYRATLSKFAPALDLSKATPKQMREIAPWLERLPKAEKASKPIDPEAGRHNLASETETNRHNMALEARPVGGRHSKGAAAPSKPVESGKYETITDPGERETVRAIVEGRAPPPAPGSKFGQHIMGLVAQIDPGFDSSKYAAYSGVRDKLSKSDEVVALNTAFAHIKRTRANVPDNFDPQLLNRVKRVLQTGSGADALSPFEADVKIAADELAKAYGNNSEAGRSTIEHLLDPNQSKAQLVSRLTEIEELLGGKIASFQDQFNRVAPEKAAPFRVMAPEHGGAVDIVDKNGQHYHPPIDEADALRDELKSEGLL